MKNNPTSQDGGEPGRATGGNETNPTITVRPSDNSKKPTEDYIHPKQNNLTTLIGAFCLVLLTVLFVILVLITIYNKL